MLRGLWLLETKAFPLLHIQFEAIIQSTNVAHVTGKKYTARELMRGFHAENASTSRQRREKNGLKHDQRKSKWKKMQRERKYKKEKGRKNSFDYSSKGKAFQLELVLLPF